MGTDRAVVVARGGPIWLHRTIGGERAGRAYFLLYLHRPVRDPARARADRIPNGARSLAHKLTVSIGSRCAAVHDRDANGPLAAQELDRNAIAVAAGDQIDTALTEPQVAQLDLVEERGQARIGEADFAALRVKFEPERGLQEQERGGACPRLRRTSDRIERRTPPAPALEAAEQFGESPQVHIGCGLEQSFEYRFDRGLVSVARKTERNQRIVVRPNRAIVIRHRIVSRL